MASTSLIFDILAKDRASGVFKSLSHEVDGFDKKLRGLGKLGDVGGKVALGATAGLVAIVGVTANFEKAMSGVKAATGEGEAGMKALREAALQAGADTAFSASEAAAGITALSKAGVESRDILGGGLTGALDLAAAGEIDVAVAAETAASAMTQFGLAGKDVPHIADLLAAAAGKAQGEVTDMAAALNQSGLIADQVGLSIEETTGGLAAFASAGLLGSDAGTSFKTMLGALTPNSAKAKGAMDELGISAYDAQGNFIGLSEFAGKLQVGLADLTDEQRQATLETIFGSDAVRAASILYEQGSDGIQSWIDKTNDAGFASEQAATKLDNLAGDFEALKGSLETALIGAGEGSQGPLRSLVQGLTGVTNAFNDLPGPAKSATTGLLGVTAVLGGGLWATSKVVQGIADTKQALSNLGVQAGQTKSVLVGLGAAAGALAVAIPILRQLNDITLDKLTIGTGNLQRDLESISKGVSTDAIADFVNQLQGLTATGAGAHEALGEVHTAFGLFGDTGGDKATKNIQEVDEALASLVESGNADQAATVVAELREAYKAAGGAVTDVDAALTRYDTALKNAGLRTTWVQKALADMGIGATDAAGATDKAGDAANEAGPRFEAMSKALKASRSAARGTANEFFGLGDSLDDNKTSLAQWIRDMEQSADALRNFRKNAEKAAREGLDEGLIQSLNEAGPAGALRMRQLSNATDAEIKKANKAWRDGQSEVNKYTDAVGGVPRRVSTDLNVDTHDSLPKIHGLITALSSVKDKVVHITTVFDRNNINLGNGDVNPNPRGRTTIDPRMGIDPRVSLRQTNAFKGLGAGVIRAFAQGINGNSRQAESAVERMLNAIKKAVGDKKITEAAAKRMRETVQEMAREAEKGRALLSKRLDFANTLKSSFMDELDLGGIVSSETFSGIGDITGNVQALANRLRAFAGQLSELRQAGIPRNLIGEIASLGSDQGSKAAAAILGGSQASQNALASAYNQFQNAAGLAGNSGADARYGTVRQIKNEYHVTIHAGLGSNPRQIASEVEKALAKLARDEGRALNFRAQT